MGRVNGGLEAFRLISCLAWALLLVSRDDHSKLIRKRHLNMINML